MKERLAYALATLLLLTGCASGGQAARVADPAAAADESTPAQREPMSVEEAAAYFLKHVCPMNAMADEYDDVYLAAYAEAEEGGSPSLGSLTEASAEMRDAARDLADAFSDEDIRWPSVIEEDIEPLLDVQYDYIASMAVLANAKTTDQFFFLMSGVEQKAALSNGGAISQEIRAKLNLSADPAYSCRNYTSS
jgi:hypothetical protein